MISGLKVIKIGNDCVTLHFASVLYQNVTLVTILLTDIRKINVLLYLALVLNMRMMKTKSGLNVTILITLIS